MYTVESPNKRPAVIVSLVGRLSSFGGLKCISIIGKLTFGDIKNVLVERLYLSLMAFIRDSTVFCFKDIYC